MSDDSERFESEPGSAPKRKPRTRRTAADADAIEASGSTEAALPPPAELPPASFDDLRRAGERFVRDRPLAAFALAVGLGYLLGRCRR